MLFILPLLVVAGAAAIGLPARRKLWDWTKTTGTIEPGKAADLVLVNGDPLADLDLLESVVMVVKEGRVVFSR
jgi:imidazolonepropionase-like amidohydrolase